MLIRLLQPTSLSIVLACYENLITLSHPFHVSFTSKTTFSFTDFHQEEKERVLKLVLLVSTVPHEKRRVRYCISGSRHGDDYASFIIS